jgi:hypothetical protein
VHGEDQPYRVAVTKVGLRRRWEAQKPASLAQGVVIVYAEMYDGAPSVGRFGLEALSPIGGGIET